MQTRSRIETRERRSQEGFDEETAVHQSIDRMDQSIIVGKDRCWLQTVTRRGARTRRVVVDRFVQNGSVGPSGRTRHDKIPIHGEERQEGIALCDILIELNRLFKILPRSHLKLADRRVQFGMELEATPRLLGD